MIDLMTFTLRLGAALLAGLLVGLEREWKHKNAGLRTNTLVAVGSAIYVMISVDVAATAEMADATRVIGQVVTGVGFLGAGVILHRGQNVRGLTTAAGIWCSAAVGCLAGLGLFAETGITTGAIIIVNGVFIWVDRWLEQRKPPRAKTPAEERETS
ncbi:MAG: MgtC/SapB family protein [Lewinella sp.]|nr:MgtC/SapB family protein [Lewinella sp.]